MLEQRRHGCRGLGQRQASLGLLAGLFLLGLGWSCTMVAGSNLVAAGSEVRDRASVQGASDLVMGLSAAAAGGLAGVVVQHLGYDWLGGAGAAVALLLAVSTVASARRVPSSPGRTPAR